MKILENLRLYFDRRDFQLIVLLFIADIALTFYGITFAGGAEGSPFFRPFTSNSIYMIIGTGTYLLILTILNKLLTGRIRTIASSTAAGMHFGGIASWIIYLVSIEKTSSIQYMLFIIISISTAISYSEFKKRNWIY